MTTGTELILTSQFNAEDDPFAEYMWMENEEEFNRQVRSWAEAHLGWKWKICVYGGKMVKDSEIKFIMEEEKSSKNKAGWSFKVEQI